jgi:hypothetical protein
MRHGARTRRGRGKRHEVHPENRADQALHIVQTRQTRMRVIVYLYLAKQVLIHTETCLKLGKDSNISEKCFAQIRKYILLLKVYFTKQCMFKLLYVLLLLATPPQYHFITKIMHIYH